MKILVPACLAMALLLPGAAALAQRPGPPSFDSLDTNHDGSLSKDEFKAMFARARNGERRRDGGGMRGSGDMPGGPGGMNGGPGGMRGQRPDPDQIFSRWDTDGNGVISKEEFDARPRFRRERGGAPQSSGPEGASPEG